MIRPSHSLDILRWPRLGRDGMRNRAYPLDRLGIGGITSWPIFERIGECLPFRGKRCSWVSVQGTRIGAMATARPRSGPKSWEISRLFLAPQGGSELPELLLRVCRSVARRGGERVFIRLPAGDPLVDVARRGGFFPSHNEVLFRWQPPGAAARAAITVRPRRPSDDLGLFRLYHAATPAEVRSAVGMTLDQWHASQERALGRVEEVVYERDGLVGGWLRMMRRSRRAQFLITVRPEDESNVGALVDCALDSVRGATEVYWLVPEYHALLARMLAHLGCREMGIYTTSIRPTAITERDKEAQSTVRAVSS